MTIGNRICGVLHLLPLHLLLRPSPLLAFRFRPYDLRYALA